MKKVTKEVIEESASKIMIKLSDEEISHLFDEFEIIVKHMDKISKLPGIDEAMPMTFPFDVNNYYLREDDFCSSIEREELLKNAPSVKDGQIVVPRVIKK